MDLQKLYGTKGEEVNILEMVKREPEWAANRIQEGESFYEELRKLRNSLENWKDVFEKWWEIEGYKKSCKGGNLANVECNDIIEKRGTGGRPYFIANNSVICFTRGGIAFKEKTY